MKWGVILYNGEMSDALELVEVEEIAWGGWERNLRLSGGGVELVISLDVGPRVLSFKRQEGVEFFKSYGEQLGGSGEAEWKIRGGHRLWVSPEVREVTYDPDNAPVEWTRSGGGIELVQESKKTGLRKRLWVELRGNGQVIVDHAVRNEWDAPRKIAAWGLSVMAAGGNLVVPQRPPGVSTEGLLPDRRLIVWPYTSLGDTRYQWGERFWQLQQRPGCKATKFGAEFRYGWAGYFLEGEIFVKHVEYRKGEEYPDFGSNFEAYTNEEMLEIESLSGLKNLQKGETVGHREQWWILPRLHPEKELSEDVLEEEFAYIRSNCVSEAGVFE